MSKKRLQYTYDAVGNRSLLVDPDGGRFTYAYDSLNRISQLENPQSERTTYAYDANGRRTLKRMANGTRASFTYDDASNLTRVADIKSDGTTITSFDYQYDKAGNRTSVLENDGSRVTWTYDNTHQLLSEHRTGSNGYRNTFTYDAAGNRTLKNESGQRTTYAYDAANQLETAQDASGLTTYTFDADGNQQLVQDPSGDRTTTVWGYENRTSVVQLPSGIRNTMAYRPDGLRILLEDSTDTKLFVWDDQRYLIEANDFGDTIAWYTVEPATYGRIISKQEGQRRFFHYDALGSTRATTSAGQGIHNRYTYDAWGNVVASTGNDRNPFQYVGELGYYADHNTDNYYVRARIYQPVCGSWLAVDPSSFPDARSRYCYAANNPLNDADPSGLLVPAVLAGVAVAIAACGLPFHNYAHNTYGASSDKFKHCWVSCQMSRACTGILTQYAGLGKEAADILRDLLGMEGHAGFADALDDLVANQQCVHWESYIPVINLFGYCRESCYDCCSREVGFR